MSLACQHLDRFCCSYQAGRGLDVMCFVAGKVVALHRSGVDMPFLSAVASAVASAEPACAMLLTADDGAERLVTWGTSMLLDQQWQVPNASTLQVHGWHLPHAHCSLQGQPGGRMVL